MVVINVLIVVAKILFFSELGSFFVIISLVVGLIGGGRFGLAFRKVFLSFTGKTL